MASKEQIDRDAVETSKKEIGSHGNGKLYRQGVLDVVVLEGTFMEMGRQYGTLLKDKILAIQNRHHTLPALRRTAAGCSGHYRSRPDSQDPRPRQQPSTTTAAASAHRVKPDPTRSVRRTLKSPRQQPRLRT